MQKLYQSCYVSHNETLKPDKRFCYDFVIRMFFHLASFFGSSTADYLVPRPSIPHRGTASVYLLLIVSYLHSRAAAVWAPLDGALGPAQPVAVVADDVLLQRQLPRRTVVHLLQAHLQLQSMSVKVNHLRFLHKNVS